MRVLRVVVALACLAAGLVVGGLNTQPVRLDLGFAQWPTTLGVAVLVALLAGALVGGLALAASGLRPGRRADRAAGRDASRDGGVR